MTEVYSKWLFGLDAVHWDRPLWIAVTILASALYYWLARQSLKRTLVPFSHRRLGSTLSRSKGTGLQANISVLLLTLTVVLGGLSLAQPYVTKKVEPMEQRWESRDIVIMLDLSLSMKSFLKSEVLFSKQDLMEQFALHLLHQIHEQGADDRVSIQVFGDEQFGLFPLTYDLAIVANLIVGVEHTLPSRLRGTNIYKGLMGALDHLDESGQHDSQLVIIITDALDSVSVEEKKLLVSRFNMERPKRHLILAGIGLGSSDAYFRLCKSLKQSVCLSELNIQSEKEIVDYINNLPRQRIENRFISGVRDYAPMRVATMLSAVFIILWMAHAIVFAQVPAVISLYNDDRQQLKKSVTL